MKLDFAAKSRKFAAAIERIKTKKLFLDAARETKELALDLNRLQLLSGEDSEGESLGEYAESNKKKSGRRDLYNTGKFQKALYLDTKQIPIFIDSKDEKTGILKHVYGPILGLVDENKSKYGKEVMEVYKDKVNSAIEDLKEKILL